jgi:surface antigen
MGFERTCSAVVLVAFLAASGCAATDPYAGRKTTVGGLGGAAAGGLLGAAVDGGTKGIIAGVLIGGLLGGAVGNVLDQRDREMALRTAQLSLETAPTGVTSNWVNPDTGHAGSFTPVNTYQTASGQYCREYQQTVTVGGEQQQGYGTACRMPDGSWQVQN